MSASAQLARIRESLYLDPRDQKVARRFRKIVQSEFRITTEVDPSETRIAEIEINKNCNLNCTMCNTQLSKRPNTYMDLGLFEESLLHAKRLGQTGGLALHTIGDPLIHPRLGDYLALLRKHELTILLSSNMLAFERQQETLREYADVIEKIRFSIDGATKETYEAIRRPGKFENLIENLELFRTMNEGGRYFDNVAIDSVVSEDVRHELAYHVSFYSRYVPMRNIGLHLVNGLSPDNTYFFEKTILKKHIVPTLHCNQLGEPLMHVLNDGRVTACCRDYDGELTFGEIQESLPEDLINSERIRELRQENIDGTSPKGSLCDTCFSIEPRVDQLFDLFVTELIARNEHDWDVDRMQARFDRFFDLFESGIPARGRFMSLLRGR